MRNWNFLGAATAVLALTTPGVHAQDGAKPAAGRGAAAASPLRWGLDDLHLESGVFDDSPRADGQTTLKLAGSVRWQPNRNLEIRAGVRLDGTSQHGGTAAFDRWRGDLTDTYLRYRSGDTRVTLGAQTIVWGRIDELPLIDRVSRADLSRFILDDLADRRRATPALRWEQDLDAYKIDAVGLIGFREAVLPDWRSVWSPIDRSSGRVFGIEPEPGLSAFVRGAAIARDDASSGGGAIRVTRTGEPPLDFGLTLARTRASLPYFRVDTAAARLVEVHPWQSFVGADLEFVTGGVTWRSELGYTEGLPLTSIFGARQARGKSWDWVGAAEFFPGGDETRVNLQLVVHRARASGPVLERTRYTGVTGEIETRVSQGRWKLGVRFASGLNAHDVYVAPKIAWMGWEPHEIYLVARYFDGDGRALGGFHRDHGMVAVGLRTRF